MKYVGIFTSSEVKNRYSSKRYSHYYSHSTTFHGKEVKWFEVIEDTSMQPVVITRSNIKQFHLFFTQTQAI
jgi:hypothetical protein